MIERIRRFIEIECGLTPADVIIAAVSGGPDSVCMLDVLRQAGYSLVIAHFNHQIRIEASQDAAYVKKMANQYGIPFVLGTGSVKNLAESQGLSVEEAARQLRYEFLFEQARLHSAQAVVTGHTADDQVETVLMHLLRGAGLAGLKGMQPRSEKHGWDKSIPLVRPLLETWRKETQAYCDQNKLSPVHDKTNDDPAFFRNRIRHELIPVLETYNPGIREIIHRTATILAGDYDTLAKAIDETWRNCIKTSGPRYVTFDRKGLNDLSAGLQRSLFRKAIEQIRTGLHNVDMETVEAATRLVTVSDFSGKRMVGNGLYVLAEENRFSIVAEGAELPADDWPQLDNGCQFTLLVPGTVPLREGWVLQACYVPMGDNRSTKAAALRNEDPFQAWIDTRTIDSLSVRSRRPGDRWQPLGMETGSQKLSDFFVNVKCPTRARENWPLVYAGETLAWIPGYRPGHSYRLTDCSEKILYLRTWKSRPDSLRPVVSI